MSPMISLSIYLTIGFIGGIGGLYSRLPAGTLLGTVLAVVFLKIFLHTSWQIPKGYGFLCQVFLGVLIGVTFQPTMIRLMANLFIPMFLSTVLLIICGVLMALVFSKFWPINLSTAYIATSPGGMVALVPMAIDQQVNAALVASFHFFRIFTVICTAPFIFKYIIR